MNRKLPEPKQLFINRMKSLLVDKEYFDNYLKILKKIPEKSIRCNTLKISPEELRKKLENKSWKISQPWQKYPEIMIVENNLEPGELGRALEHLLGYYYAQELASMLPVIALNPQKNNIVLDLCASPGSKTTQISAKMQNTGTIIANEVSLGRIKILASNLERCGCTNVIITKKDGSTLCKKLKKNNFLFDKILVDAPCSGEGTLRSTPKSYLMWNPKTIKSVSRVQKSLLTNAIELLKPDGELVYSTCTHAPEENEEVVDYALKMFGDKIKVIKSELPIKTRQGIKKWENEKYAEEIKLASRVYPQDNNTEGFFLVKIRRVK